MSNLRFYSIEFISKDGYKSTCIMPAYDENMAKNKFVRLMNLRGDKRPNITKCEDLGLLDAELKKFCEEFNATEDKSEDENGGKLMPRLKTKNFSERLNFAFNIDKSIRDALSKLHSKLYREIHYHPDPVPLNGTDFDIKNITPKIADRIMQIAGSILGTSIVKISTDMSKIGGFYGLEPLIYCIKKYPDMVKKYFGVEVDWIDLNNMIKYTDVANMNDNGYEFRDDNMLVDCLFYSGERFDYFKKFVELLDPNTQKDFKRAVEKGLEFLKSIRNKDDMILNSIEFFNQDIPYKEFMKMTDDQKLNLAHKTIDDVIDRLKKG